MRISRRTVQFILFALVIGYAVLRLMPRTGGITCSFEARYPAGALFYVDHALCRMECRNISRKLVEQVYRDGEVNCDRSAYKGENPRYALEKRDGLGDKIRVIVEVEEGRHVIVTAIRIGKPDRCECS